MRRRRPILTVFLTAMLFLVAAIAIWRTSVSSANKDRLRAIAARGEPTSLAELNTFYRAVPDQSNAALLWLKGSAALTNDLGNIAGKLPLKRGVPSNQEQLDEAAEALAANTNALALFHEAVRLDHSRFPITLSHEAFTNMGYLSAMKGAAQVLRAQAAVAIAKTNTAPASQAISGIFAAGHSI